LSALSAGIFRFKGVSDRMRQSGVTFYALATLVLSPPTSAKRCRPPHATFNRSMDRQITSYDELI
jgi:hypothetical protein